MSFIRPQITRALWRLHEALTAGAVLLCGLWLVWMGGWLLVPAGLALAALGASLLRHALARLRFHQATHAPGMVELDEAQLGYLGPQSGGFISLHEASELRLVVIRGRRLWRIKQADGQAMLVPIDAQGAAQLFDAFAALPGMDVTALAAAASPGAGALTGGQDLAAADPQMLLVWRRPGAQGLAPR